MTFKANKYFLTSATLLIIISSLLFTNCRKKQDEVVAPVKQATVELHEIMKAYYYWNNLMKIVSTDNYQDPYTLMDDLRYRDDKWSFVSSKQEMDDFLEGKMGDHGIYFIIDENKKIRVAFLYNSSDCYKAGIKRGFKLLEVNGSKAYMDNYYTLFNGNTIGTTDSLLFSDENGSKYTVVSTIAYRDINTVLFSKVFDLNGKKTGYLVLQSFIEPTKEELIKELQYFINENISNLILDLRYNGGGLVETARFLSSCISNEKTLGKVFTNYKFNPSLQEEYNYAVLFDTTDYNLNLSELIVITSPNTASASELIINNLKPYIKVTLIGTPTHGKPVGMFIFDYQDYSFVPVVFETSNALDEGKYFNGIDVDDFALDDVIREFGDTAENCLKQSLYYIEKGVFMPDYKNAIFTHKLLLNNTGLMEQSLYLKRVWKKNASY